ncbi:unnamed protein product [Acanthoscelides obtectus]|uniref:Uncharacterized protein n=1 Tax=Acanthoscelides obtectus TaxID=200917 RepID=A0A9P0Q7N7_ACAOB|nr:unnamed protein product [Acanthoscelides obtectus]CAK1659540.1 General transcription factor II-I repeat domain-containing protein 2B [Acanthoscelides obtectus]
MVGLTIDGAPAMVGPNRGLEGLCRKDESFPRCLCYHCVIYQQALCGHFLILSIVMKLVVKIVNKIRAQASQRRLLKTLADEIDYVRWLMKRFKIISAIVQFFKQRDEPIPQLEISIWLRDFGFLVDIAEKLNELNLQLQGRDKAETSRNDFWCKAFIKKLELWEENLIDGDPRHFPVLSE